MWMSPGVAGEITFCSARDAVAAVPDAVASDGRLGSVPAAFAHTAAQACSARQTDDDVAESDSGVASVPGAADCFRSRYAPRGVNNVDASSPQPAVLTISSTAFHRALTIAVESFRTASLLTKFFVVPPHSVHYIV